MSAVIMQFPSNPRELSERRRAAKDSVDERARSTNATVDQRRAALAAVLASLDRGDSLGSAIQRGYDQLPSVRRQAYRVPIFPGDAA